MTVDGVPSLLRANTGDTRHMDITSALYVGGVDTSRESQAKKQGLVTLLDPNNQISFKGCLHNIRVNSAVMGFREMQVNCDAKITFNFHSVLRTKMF